MIICGKVDTRNSLNTCISLTANPETTSPHFTWILCQWIQQNTYLRYPNKTIKKTTPNNTYQNSTAITQYFIVLSIINNSEVYKSTRKVICRAYIQKQ